MDSSPIHEADRHEVLRSHFEAAHASKTDPWGVETRWYEIRKRSVTMASLPHERYRRTLEIGCSVGALTEMLAARSEELLAVDLAAAAVARAQLRVVDANHVEVRQHDVVDGLPAGVWDLIVLSEVGYYLEPNALRELARALAPALRPSGVVVACHWRYQEADFEQSGDDVHRALVEASGLWRIAHHEERDFVLDVLGMADASVAQSTGLVAR